MRILLLSRNDAGAVAVEFAMILPVLALMLAGMADFGTYIHEKMQLDALARASVQYVVQGGDPQKAEVDIVQTNQVYQQLKTNNQPMGYTGTTSCECSSGASVNCSTGSCPPGDYVRSFYTVQIDTTYPTILPWPGIPDSLALEGYARMQYDR